MIFHNEIDTIITMHLLSGMLFTKFSDSNDSRQNLSTMDADDLMKAKKWKRHGVFWNKTQLEVTRISYL